MVTPNQAIAGPEQRGAPGELRAAGEDGIIEGYAAVWNTVDDYQSSFQRGCFAKTLQERGARIKVVWNHNEDELIGKPLELREDDYGLFVRAQLVLSVARAREVYDMAKAGVVDTFSFAFRTVKDKWVDGVRVITEAMLKEVSPVAFEANPAAVITGVRSMQTEQRSQDYKTTYDAYELNQRGSLILGALMRTLDDIWWGGAEGDALQQAVDTAVGDFGAMYSLFTADMVTARAREMRGSAVQIEMRKFLSQSQQTPEQLAATTPLTLGEVNALLAGELLPATDKLTVVPEEVRAAHAAARMAKVEALFGELRAGFLPAELDRLRGLLPQQEDPHAAAIDEIHRHITQFRSSIGKAITTTPQT